MSKWRDDYQSDEAPTINFCVICAIDVLPKLSKQIYSVTIQHVRTIHGRAFMANIHNGCGDTFTGGWHHGTGEEAYQKALNEAVIIQDRMIEEGKNQGKDIS